MYPSKKVSRLVVRNDHEESILPLVNGGVLTLTLNFLHEKGFPVVVRMGAPIRFMDVDLVVRDQVIGFRGRKFYKLKYAGGMTEKFNRILNLHQQWIMKNGI